jgi:uncharacterized protein YecT (DUF1311 family)
MCHLQCCGENKLEFGTPLLALLFEFRISMKLWVKLALILAVSPYVAAREDHGDCDKKQNTNDINQCIQSEMEASKTRLIGSFELVSLAIQSAYDSSPGLKENLLHRVEQSQLAWAAFRDAECKVEAFVAEEGSVTYQALINQCVVDMNNARIKHLNNLSSSYN